MSPLEIIGLVSFIGFMIGMVSLMVTCCLLLGDINSKVLHRLLKISIWTYGIFGFGAIIISFINELIG